MMKSCISTVSHQFATASPHRLPDLHIRAPLDGGPAAPRRGAHGALLAHRQLLPSPARALGPGLPRLGPGQPIGGPPLPGRALRAAGEPLPLLRRQSLPRGGGDGGGGPGRRGPGHAGGGAQLAGAGPGAEVAGPGCGGAEAGRGDVLGAGGAVHRVVRHGEAGGDGEGGAGGCGGRQEGGVGPRAEDVLRVGVRKNSLLRTICHLSLTTDELRCSSELEGNQMKREGIC